MISKNTIHKDLLLRKSRTRYYFTFLKSYQLLIVIFFLFSLWTCSNGGDSDNGNGEAQNTDEIDYRNITVEALYPENGKQWNDYVVRDGANQFDASDRTCDTDNIDSDYFTCIHGGELRYVEVPGYSSCTDLSAYDALSAFNWTCDESTTPIRMVSTGLRSIVPLKGTATNTTTGQLVSSTASFVSDGVEIGDLIINTSNYSITSVTGIDSENSLSLVDDIFVAGESYSIEMDKNLADLIDFSNSGGWKNNFVTVKEGSTVLFSTASSVWWNNPIVIDNDGGSLATTGTIYLVTVDSNSDYSLDANKLALVVMPGVTLTGGNIYADAIFALSQNFLWLEGRLNANMKDSGVYLEDIRFSVMRGIVCENADYNLWLESGSGNLLKNIVTNNTSTDTTTGVYLNQASYNTLDNITTIGNPDGVIFEDSPNNLLHNITAMSNTRFGVWLLGLSNDNSLRNVIAANNDVGIYLSGSMGNILTGISVYNNNNGMYLDTFSNNNSISNLAATKNRNNGIWLNSSSGNTLSSLTVTNNDIGVYLENSSNSNTALNATITNNNYGVWLNGTSNNNTVANLTLANNETGFYLLGSSNNNLLNTIAINNKFEGIDLDTSSNNSLSNIASTNNGGYGIYLLNSSNNYFTGLLKVEYNNENGNECFVSSGTNPGLDDAIDCANNGNSDATRITVATLESSFVGAIRLDGSNSTSHSDGIANYDDITDWTNFDSIYRVWGLNVGMVPIDTGNRGPGSANKSMRMWDWSLLLNDIEIQEVLDKHLTGNNVVNSVADNTIEHTWSDGATVAYLRNSIEIIGDGLDNENGLCEQDESCLYTPNIGSYQGHGTLQSAGTFSGGDTINSIKFLEFSIKGY